MTRDFGISPGIEHCVCMVDLLGQSRVFVKAEKFLKEMPVSPNEFMVMLNLVKELPSNLSKWDLMMIQLMFFIKTCVHPVETRRTRRLKNKVTSFGVGDQTHSQTKNIDAKREEMKKLITKAGYVPDKSFALHDTNEEQKEHNPWNHSERLALAYGLIYSPEGSTIRIFKNLRQLVGKFCLRIPFSFITSKVASVHVGNSGS
ncbi:hypothetical protein RDABS01_003192 [Bienertia sinuspersici]